MKKECKKCSTVKYFKDFYNSKDTLDGKTYNCKKCMSEYRNNKKEENRLYAELNRKNNPEKVCKQRRDSWRNLNPSKKLLQQAKNRAKRKELEFNLEITDIIIPEICPYLGVPFIVGTKDNYEYTHSLDRIDNSKGYIKGNIEVISKKANSMKNSASKEELINFAYTILNKFR